MIGNRRTRSVSSFRSRCVRIAALLFVHLPEVLQAGERGTAYQAQDLVKRAIELYDSQGMRAFYTITRDPSFVEHDLYVFVIDRIGSIAAHGINPRMVGANALNARDPEGVWYVREMLERATPAGVWVDYISLDPLLGERAPKSTWVVRHDGFVFACGIYAGELSI